MKPLSTGWTPCLMICLVLASAPISAQTYLCDARTDAPRVTIDGDQGWRQTRFNAGDLQDGAVVDGRSAVWHFNNSRNANPTYGYTCNEGTLRVQKYPIVFRGNTDICLSGGSVEGEVPMGSYWQPTYCNASAVTWIGSVNPTVESIRIDRVWDGVRFNPQNAGASLSVVRNVWLTNVRDDCVENDWNGELLIEDSLFDGCFSGVSVAPNSKCQESADCRNGSGQTRVFLHRVLLRSQGSKYQDWGYDFDGENLPLFHQAQVKRNPDGARLAVFDSIFAGDFYWPNLRTRTRRMWEGIDPENCGNNQLLWLSDDLEWPPDNYPTNAIPECFTILTGPEARERWNSARNRWIEDHPDLGESM